MLGIFIHVNADRRRGKSIPALYERTLRFSGKQGAGLLRFEFACFCLCDDQFATQETSEKRFCVFQFSIWQSQCCLGIAVPQSLVSMPRVPSPQVVLYCRHLFIAPPSFISNRIPPFIRISSPRPLDAPSVISRETRSNGIPRESTPPLFIKMCDLLQNSAILFRME